MRRREMGFLLVGLLLGVVATLGIGAVSGRSEIGRYSVSVWGNTTYIIDTTTSELWERRGKHVFKRGTIAKPLWEYRSLSADDAEALTNFLP